VGAAVPGLRALLQGLMLRFLVVVPALVPAGGGAERENLARCIAALRAATPAPEAIVLVDDGSAEPIAGWIGDEPGPPVRVLRQDNAGPATARNTGARSFEPADDAVLVFVDADIIVPGDTFARLAADFARWPDAQAIWGTVTAAHPHRGAISTYKNLTHRHFTLAQPERTRHLTTMLAAVRRPAFDAAGGFDEAFRTVSVEDVELGRSLHDRGLAVYLDAGLAAEHRHNFTALGALRNDFRKARGMASATLDRRARGERSVQVDGAGERRQVRYLLSVPLGVGAVGSALAGRWRWSAACLAGMAFLERDLLRFIQEDQGPLFAAAVVPWMAIERTNVAAALVAGTGDHLVRRLRRKVRPLLPVRTGG